MRRARLHEAAQRTNSGEVDRAELAADLGYADQSRLTRDFTAVVGVPPSRYCRGERGSARGASPSHLRSRLGGRWARGATRGLTR
ncbi:helix-turn-helix domain-containing protein [Kitasatospora sp. NPDC056531]|uniref:helix-turn-helix domain-containing protein n=1 Tax=Kitasatospora sp. NPDC056531 TaxID=3345856 RepID=UPI0036B3A00F